MLRLIPGAPGQTTFRALVLVRGSNATPRVVFEGQGIPVLAEVTPLQPSHRLRPHLRDPSSGEPISLYLARGANLQPDRPYAILSPDDPELPPVPVRTLPKRISPDGLSVVVASCYYDYFKFDKKYCDALKDASRWFMPPPAFKLLIGDNFYADVAPDQTDILGGYEETAARYIHYFWESGYHQVLATLPTLTTFDDHEFWNNYPEIQPYLSRTNEENYREYQAAGQECLNLFQISLNPDPIVTTGRSYVVNIPPISLFVADTRSQRTLVSQESPHLMNPGELQALVDWARTLSGPGVLVLGQPLWLEQGDWLDYTPADFEDDYARLWQATATAPHDILVVSGDVHHSRLIQVGLPGGRPIYEFVTSPACHIPTERGIIWGDYYPQGKSKISLPRYVPVKPPYQPKLMSYFFGAGEKTPNTFGMLHFQPVGDGIVSVGCAFIDIKNNTPAEAEAAEISEGFLWTTTDEPMRSKCLDPSLLTLR